MTLQELLDRIHAGDEPALATLQDLLDRVRAGDEQARHELVRLINNHYRFRVHLILRYENSELGHFEQTDGILNDVLLRFDRRLKVVDLSKLPAHATELERWLEFWFSRFVRQVLIDKAREYLSRTKRARQPKALDHDPEAPASRDQDQRFQKLIRLPELIDRLPDEERDVVELRYSGLKKSSIARLLRIDRGTVDRRLRRAQATLGQWLREESGDDLEE